MIVSGEGSVSVSPDYAEVTAGATTRAKTAKEAADANTKLMTAITAALTGAGIAQKDIQTARFSVQPVYTSPQPGTEQKLAGFAVSNQVTVKIRSSVRSATFSTACSPPARPISAMSNFCMPISPRRWMRRATPPSPMRGARRNYMRTRRT